MPTSARSDGDARRLFAHSAMDGILALLGLAHVSGLALAVVYFDALSWLERGGVVLVSALLTCTNFQCIAHNALHLPFFRARWAIRNPRRPGRPLNALQYVTAGLLRSELGALYADASTLGTRRQVWVECAVLFCFALWAISTNWLAFLLVVVPSTLSGYAFALLENYCEHCYAVSGNRLTDSVSCYAKFYNWIWFNNGYHQEHHFRPQTHWTAVPALRDQMLPEAERRVVPGLHLTALWIKR
jgi:fatty acid desaturase